MSPCAEAPDPFYAFLRLVARFWLRFLFRDVAVRHAGRVPPEGPVLLCVNHPNNLIDSLLVGAVLPRKVHYLASAPFFRNPVLAWHVKDSPKAEGQNRIHVAGEPEWECEQRRRREGIPLAPSLVTQLREVSVEAGVSFTLGA